MRANIGIRRRLAPLLDNDRNQIELFTALLLSLPGSPILYYGDEIGMGDNIWLGDRDGVRTPMQWTPDRNAGFSSSDPGRLYLPAIMDPVYGYQVTNVEAQLRQLHVAAALDPPDDRDPQAEPGVRPRHLHRHSAAPTRACSPSCASSATTSCCASTTCPGSRSRSSSTCGAGRATSPVELIGGGALPADRRAALPADPGRPRLLLVPAQPAGGRELMPARLDRPTDPGRVTSANQRWFAGKGRAWTVDRRADRRRAARAGRGRPRRAHRPRRRSPTPTASTETYQLPLGVLRRRRAEHLAHAFVGDEADGDGGTRLRLRRAARQGQHRPVARGHRRPTGPATASPSTATRRRPSCRRAARRSSSAPSRATPRWSSATP